MNISKLSHFTTTEIIIFIVFLVYILFPINTPHGMRAFLHSAFGSILLSVIIGLLFWFTNPILGIVSIFVAYELLRRSSYVNYMNTPDKQHHGKQRTEVVDAISSHTPLEINMETAPEVPHSFAYKTLEEEIIDMKAPVGHGNVSSQFMETSFQPVASNVDGASLY